MRRRHKRDVQCRQSWWRERACHLWHVPGVAAVPTIAAAVAASAVAASVTSAAITAGASVFAKYHAVAIASTVFAAMHHANGREQRCQRWYLGRLVHVPRRHVCYGWRQC